MALPILTLSHSQKQSCRCSLQGAALKKYINASCMLEVYMQAATPKLGIKDQAQSATSTQAYFHKATIPRAEAGVCVREREREREKFGTMARIAVLSSVFCRSSAKASVETRGHFGTC